MRVQQEIEMYTSGLGGLKKIFPDDLPVNEAAVMQRNNVFRVIYFSEQGGLTSGYDIVSNSGKGKSWKLNTTSWREPDQASNRNRELAEMIKDTLSEELGQLALTIIFY